MNIGDYVRTKRNGIIKIDEIIDNGIITYEDDFGREWEEETNLKVIRYNDKDGWNKGINENDVLKSSPNIIDLIEVGDLIKYHPIQNNYIKTNILYKVIPNGRELIALHYDITHDKKKILSIITHEQIEQMEYKI